MQLTLSHTLTFTLGTPGRAVQHLLLTPLTTAQQKVERWSIEMPGFADAVTFRDAFGNKAHLVSLVKPDPDIIVKVTGVVETFDKAGVLGRLEFDPMPAMFRRPTPLTRPDSSLTEGISFEGGRIAVLHELMDRVHQRGLSSDQSQMQTQGAQSQGDGAAAKPDDFAHALIGAARALDIPARHVTGYVLDEEGARFHAWAEAWDDGLGWIGFDAMLNLCPADTHIRLASGLDAVSTMPIRTVPVWSEMPAEVVEITAA